MKIKDLTMGKIFEYGSDRHHALVISNDGRTLSFENLQNGDGSKYGNYRFVDDCDEEVPEDTEFSEYGADSYFNVGGFNTRNPIEDIVERLEEFYDENAFEINSGFIETCIDIVKGGVEHGKTHD